MDDELARHCGLGSRLDRALQKEEGQNRYLEREHGILIPKSITRWPDKMNKEKSKLDENQDKDKEIEDPSHAREVGYEDGGKDATNRAVALYPDDDARQTDYNLGYQDGQYEFMRTRSQQGRP